MRRIQFNRFTRGVVPLTSPASMPMFYEALDKVKMAFDMYESQKFSVDQIASAVGVSRQTVYRYLNKNS